MLFKELTNLIITQSNNQKNLIMEKFSHMTTLINQYKSYSNTIIKIEESNNKGISEHSQKIDFGTSISKNFSKFEIDRSSKESGNIFGNLLSVSLRKSSISNNFKYYLNYLGARMKELITIKLILNNYHYLYYKILNFNLNVMRKDEPSVKMINNLGLFMKVKLPNSNVQSLKRKHDFVEIMKDWRFIEKKLTIKDISSLPEQSLTKKLSLLIPEHIKYKKQREEHLKNYRPPDYNFNNVPKSSHEFQNMSIK